MVVTGFVEAGFGAGKLNLLTQAYDANSGVLVWEDRDNTPAVFTGAADVAIGGNRIFVVADLITSPDEQWLVRAYEF